MKAFRRAACWNLFIALILGVSMQAQNKNPESTRDSCRHFTQEFYDWYASNAHFKKQERNGMPPLEFALKNKRSAFDPDLVRQLEDGDAQAKREGEPFLDFDPVLNSQDPSSRYVVEKLVLNGGRCWADIHSVWANKSEKPDVVAELTPRDGQWVFVDFHYPNSEDPRSDSLLHMLNFLRKTEKPAAKWLPSP